MLKVSRVLILAICAAFLATGSTLAQGAPPPAGSPAPPTQKKHACKSTPKGCQKKQNKANKSTGGAPPAGAMPPPSPHP
jgi:hypothetical protein